MDLPSAMSQLLDVAVASIDSPPERRYVTVGEAVADCDELVVTLLRLGTGLAEADRPMDLLQDPSPSSVAEIDVRLFRCAPTPDGGQLPTQAVLDSAGRSLVADAEALYFGVQGAVLTSGLFGGCSSVTVGPLTSVDALGGLWGVSLTVRVQIP